ncbi:MAG: secretin N-terminal domain-containing protein [Phycisphaerales bacterium]
MRIVVDPSTNSLVVEGSDRVSERVQQLAAELQRRSPREPTTVRIVELPAGSDPNAVASFVNQTVRELGRTSQDNPGGFSGRVTVSPDRTSGTLIVWANDTDFGTVKDLIAGLTRLDRSVSLSVKIYPLNNTQAGRARQSVMELLNPQQGPGRRSGEVELTIPDGKGGEQKATIDSSRVTVTTDPSLTSLIVTAPAESFGVIDRFVQMIDESPVLERLAIRRYELEHASANDLQRTLQVLFDSQRQGPVAWEQPRARFVADDRANALLVTATDEQHAEIARILQDADQSLEQDDTQLAILRVEEGRPSAIGRVIQEVLVGRDPAKKDSLRISAQDDTGVLVVRAPDADMEEIRSLVTQLDQTQGASYPVRSIKLKNGDAAAIAGSLQQFFRDRARINRQRGKAGGGGDAAIVGDQRSGTIVVSASDDDYEQIAALVEQFDAPAAGKQFRYEIIPLQHVQVSDIGQTVQNIMWEMQWERSGYFRGGSGATNEDKVYVETNDRTNSVVVFGQGEMFEVVERIIAELDQPNSDAGKVVVKAVRAPGVDLGAVERIIEQMTATPGWRVWQGRDPNAVQVEVDRRRQALILIGKQAVVEDAEKQIAEIVKGGLDEGQVVEIVALQEARAQELAQALQRALPEGLEVKITAVSRTNSILLTGSAEDVEQVKGQIAALDKEPERAPVEFRRFALKHADALDLSIVLKALVRNRPRGQGEPVPGIDALYNENTLAVTASPTEMSFIAEMVEQFDVAQETERKTEFVKLEYADAGKTAEALKVFYGRYAPEAATSAERSVSIVPDPASNSLVISADESTWEGIHNLLTKLDTADYDTSQQLVVIPLKHASATSVARALNEGFRQPLQDQLDQERVRLEAERRRQGNSNNNRDFFEPTVLVESEGVPVVSAETQTNSLIVFAGRKELDRIRQIVSQLDVADFLELPAARIVPIKAGRASQLADSARRVFVTAQDGANPRGVQIIGDDASSTVLVRADDDKFAEIRSFLADMEARASLAQASARIIRLRSIPAARVQQAVLQSLRPVAQQRGEPLSVQVEATTNSLIVSASAELHKQVESLVRELDGDPAPAGDGKGGDADVPGFGQNVTVVAVKSSDPARIVQRLNAMGVTRAQPATNPGVVSEAVGLIPMPDQSAIGVVGSARDTAIVQRLIEVLDDGSPEGEQQVAFVRLKLADANAVVQRLRQMLAPQGSVTGAGQAGALAEQVRRLRLEQDGKAVELDLTSPVRLVPEAGSNAVIVASTAGNVAAIESVIGVLDQLPIGEAVMVKIFPLENASADRVRGILDELFRQGDRLRRVPGTNRQGDPTTTVGEALSGNVALTVDERTNALVAAGPEASLALVEVLVSDLDAQDAERGWLETSLIQLKYADARTLADKLREVLVKGIGQTPEAVALRRQIGRLRVKPGEGEGVEADLYAPLSGVVITPEEDLNALIVVATPTNVRAVKELVAMLDVERASASNEVRVIPMEHADAGRVADIVRSTFAERSKLPAARAEDKVIVNVDDRTNALIVSTSRRSFEILDGLIATLDQEESRFAVGLHVIPVPGADVEALAPRLQRLMQDRLRAAKQSGGRTSAQDVFRVEPDAASGVLIVAASEENLQLVRELVASLTTGEAPAAKGEVTALVQLASPGRAREVADAVGELYVSPQNERRGARAVTVVPNERLNALLVTGTEDDVTQIRAIADRLDRAEVGLVEDVRRIPLESASARETVSLIEDVLAGRSIAGSRTGSRATRVRVISDRLAEAKAEATIDGDIRDQVNLTPDPRTNSVLIKAPPELMDLIVTMVQDLDHETRGDRVIETFRLVNADAAQMQQLLIDLFNLQQSGDRYVLAPSRDQQPDDDTQLAPSFTAIPDERQELAVTIDRRTNTLLVSGTSDLIEEVKRVVSSLDSIEANERERVVYHLKNAQAAEIEQTLQAYFQGEANLVRTTLGPDVSGSVLRELEQEVTVIGDPNSNKLVISASPRYIDTVTSIIDELDASPPQVMIEVLIAEVTLNASEEFGIDVAIGGTVATTSGSGLGSQSSSSKAGGDGYVFDALAAGSGVATALGVPNLAVASSDFGLLIRALQAQGKLEVLSRPQVQVNDNEAAFINVGENIAITDGVERRDNVTTAIVSRKDVGITLDVTPSISSDGYVRLDISPEISILSDRTTQISEDVEAPIITQRRVETTVTIKDGETVVIGGLIQTNDSQTKTKVPLLGDIPLVGGLFRTNEKSQIKTELLVILTPHVIPGERTPQTLERQRGLTDRAMNSLENRKPVEKMLELGHDPDDKVEIWEPINDGKDDDE